MGESNLLPKEGAICKAVLTAASESVRENIVKNAPFLIMIIINNEKIISFTDDIGRIPMCPFKVLLYIQTGFELSLYSTKLHVQGTRNDIWSVLDTNYTFTF